MPLDVTGRGVLGHEDEPAEDPNVPPSKDASDKDDKADKTADEPPAAEPAPPKAPAPAKGGHPSMQFTKQLCRGIRVLSQTVSEDGDSISSLCSCY